MDYGKPYVGVRPTFWGRHGGGRNPARKIGSDPEGAEPPSQGSRALAAPVFQMVPSQVDTLVDFISSSSNQWVVTHFDSV